MFKFALVTLALLGVAFAYPMDIVDVLEDETGQQFGVVPIEQMEQHRVKRAPKKCTCTESKTDVGHGSNGPFVSHTHTLLNNDNHRIDGSAFAERHLHPKGPLTTGQNVDYTHKSSASTVSVGATNTRGQGTDLKATAQYNFLQTPDGKAQVGAYGEYNRHYGGPGGTQHPQSEVGVRATINLD